MEYCKSCGAMLVKITDGKFLCSCGALNDIQQRIKIETSDVVQDLGIMDQTVHPLATHDYTCSKCGFSKAQLVSKGVSYGDEDDHFAYVCGKCGHHSVQEGKLK